MAQISHTPTYDAVVIGGGVAGLSAALTLGRALRSVLVVDAGAPRNALAAGAHNLLGHEGIAPLELLEKGRAEALSYGAQIVAGTVTDVRGSVESGFSVTLTRDGAAEAPAVAAGSLEPHTNVHARRIVLATGAVDTLPDVIGLAEHWGQDVIHCPYCHGYEVRGGRIGVLASDPMWLHKAKLIRQWSDDVTVLLHEQPAPSAEDRATLAARGVRIVEGRVREILSDRAADSDEADSRADRPRTVHSPTGESPTRESHDGDSPTGESREEKRLTGAAVDGLESPIPLDAILVSTRMGVDSALVGALGLTVEENVMGEFVPVDMGKATNVPGVFAAGNITSAGAMVAASMADGVLAAARANMDLVEEDFDLRS